MKDRKMAEYYLIGTLASITFALLVGIVVRANLAGRGMKEIMATSKGYSKREGGRVFDNRGREIDSEYLKGKVTGFVGRLEDNVLYMTYVNT